MTIVAPRPTSAQDSTFPAAFGQTSGPALLPEHRHQLEVESGIPSDILEEEDICSLPGSPGLPTPDAALRHPNSHKGQHFGRWGETDARGRPVDLGPGIWFGTRDAAGRLGGQYRPDRPRTALNGHAVKYETCRGTRPSFAVPGRCLPALMETKAEVFITEGYKKALALAGAGACAVSLAGVDAWTVKPDPNDPKSEPIDDFDAVAWHGRVVWITYDSDAAIKDGVRYAERRLAKELESRRAVVVAIRIPQAADGSKRGVDDYIRDRVAAGVSREDALSELKAMALAELTRRSELKPAAGTDGEQTCQDCEPLRGRLREYRAADELVKHGPFTPDGAQVHRRLVTMAKAARSNGKEKLSLERKDVARLALGDPGNVKAVTRALGAYRAYQDDPEILATLPYRLHWRPGGRKTHIDLYPLTSETPRSTAEDLVLLSHLPRDRKPPAKVADRDDSCRRCHSPEGVEARGTRRCLNEECGLTWHTRPVILGRADVDPIESPAPPTPVPVGTLPGQNVPPSTSTKAGHFVPASAEEPTLPLIPVSFVSDDDRVVAAGPHYRSTRGSAPCKQPKSFGAETLAPVQPPPPLPPAPTSHRAYWGRPEYRHPPAAGAEPPASPAPVPTGVSNGRIVMTRGADGVSEGYIGAAPGVVNLNPRWHAPRACCKTDGLVRPLEGGGWRCDGCGGDGVREVAG